MSRIGIFQPATLISNIMFALFGISQNKEKILIKEFLYEKQKNESS